MQAALAEVVSNQPEYLWQSVVESLPSDKQEDNNINQVLMNALAERYNSANLWETRRQILSIILADKVAFSTLKKWTPDLTRYRFGVTRRHALIHGRGVPIPRIKRTRMFVSSIQLDHFLDIISSPYVIQNVPEQKSIDLSTKKIVKVSNVIRILIPESIVKQYLAYVVESNFMPLSQSTLLRILSVCSAFV